MNFKFEGVESGDPSRIGPGVSEVTITKIEEGKMPYGNDIPSLEISFMDDTKAIFTEKFDMNTEVAEGKEESNEERNLRRIKHIGTKVVDEPTFNSIRNTAQLATHLVGKKIRIKFSAREYTDKNGGVKVATQLPNFFFAEDVKTTPTKLKYDPTNKWDYKKITGTAPSANGTTHSEAVSAAIDGLPF